MARRKAVAAEAAQDTLPKPPPVPGVPSRPASLRRRYVSSGIENGLPTGASILVRYNSDIDYWFGDGIKDRMLTDPAVTAAVNFLVFAAVHNEVRVVPAQVVKLRPGEVPTAEQQALMDEAQRYADFVQTCQDRLETPIEDVLHDMRDAVTHGSSLAEVTMSYGEYEGETRLMLDSITPKPRTTWNFVVDPFMKVVGVYCESTEPEAAWTVIPPEKALWMTWMPRNADPRGTSILRPAFNAWNFKNRVWPEHMKWLTRFGTPSVLGVTSPDSVPSESTSFASGSSTGIDGESALGEDPESALLATLRQLSNGAAVVVPHGTEVDYLEPSTTGEQFRSGYQECDRQIVMAILTSVRAILEAEHGSRADSGDAQSVVANLINSVRRMMCRALSWRVYHTLMLANFGPDVAQKFTPTASLGDAEQRDIPSLIRAFRQAGYLIDPMHLGEIDRVLGLSPRKYDPSAQVAGTVQPGQRSGDAGQGRPEEQDA